MFQATYKAGFSLFKAVISFGRLWHCWEFLIFVANCDSCARKKPCFIVSYTFHMIFHLVALGIEGWIIALILHPREFFIELLNENTIPAMVLSI
jgi:hypothetical protein